MSRLVLSDGTPPPGEGPGFWTQLDSPERFLAYVERRLEVGEREPVREWVPIDELNGYAVDAYVTGRRPPAMRRAVGHALRAADHLVAGWLLARAAIAAASPGAVVTLTLRPYDVYELDGLVRDVVALADRADPIRRAQLRTHLLERREKWYATRPSPSPKERAARRLGRSLVPLEQALPRALGTPGLVVTK